MVTADSLYDTSASSATVVWAQWNQQLLDVSSLGTAFTNTSVGYQTANTVWQNWNFGLTTGTSATTQTATLTFTQTWQNWNNEWYVVAGGNGITGFHGGHLTPEQLAEQAAEQARVQKEYEERRAKELAARIVALERAVALLKSLLNPEQLEEYNTGKRFHVTSKSGKRYLITRGISGNVYHVEPDGKQSKRYCIHPYESVPEEDNMAIQKLLLEHDEEHFLKVANAS